MINILKYLFENSLRNIWSSPYIILFFMIEISCRTPASAGSGSAVGNPEVGKVEGAGSEDEGVRKAIRGGKKVQGGERVWDGRRLRKSTTRGYSRHRTRA
jgi:hypothetical protein